MENKVDYNEDDVWYCKGCLSLGIVNLEDDIVPCYCKDCGGTDIGTMIIQEWELNYRNKYHKKYINKK